MRSPYLPSIQTLFRTAAIGAGVWLCILLVAASVLFIVELEKALVRRWRRRLWPGEPWSEQFSVKTSMGFLRRTRIAFRRWFQQRPGENVPGEHV